MNKEMSRLNQEQLESLTEIGAYLRQVRESYSLSLDEIAAQTMIQARLLRAIEEGSLEKLPEPVYIQGFIKLYADALGLEGNQFANAFPTERQMRVAPSSWKDSPAAQLRPLHLYVAYIALIVASVSLLSHIVNRSALTIASSVASPILTPQSAPVTTSPRGQAGSSTTTNASSQTEKRNQTTTLTPPSDSDKPVRVDIKLTSQSWLRIEIDGSTEFEGVLPEGTERTWQAENQLTVRAGNAGGVMLAYNQGRAQRMGAPGAVEEKTFTLAQDAASLPNP